MAWDTSPLETVCFTVVPPATVMRVEVLIRKPPWTLALDHRPPRRLSASWSNRTKVVGFAVAVRVVRQRNCRTLRRPGS